MCIECVNTSTDSRYDVGGWDDDDNSKKSMDSNKLIDDDSFSWGSKKKRIPKAVTY